VLSIYIMKSPITIYGCIFKFLSRNLFLIKRMFDVMNFGSIFAPYRRNKFYFEDPPRDFSLWAFTYSLCENVCLSDK